MSAWEEDILSLSFPGIVCVFNGCCWNYFHIFWCIFRTIIALQLCLQWSSLVDYVKWNILNCIVTSDINARCCSFCLISLRKFHYVKWNILNCKVTSDINARCCSFCLVPHFGGCLVAMGLTEEWRKLYEVNCNLD